MAQILILQGNAVCCLQFDYSGALSRALRLGLQLTFYYGKQDTACNYVGGYRVASESLDWKGASAFASKPQKP